MAQCEFEKTNGKSCGAPAITGSKLCFFHDPNQDAKRRQAQSAGGLASSQGRSGSEWQEVEPLPLHYAKDVAVLIAEQLNELRGLEPSPRKARAIFYGANLLLQIYRGCFRERSWGK